MKSAFHTKGTRQMYKNNNTKNTAIAVGNSQGAIATQQLSLFGSPLLTEQHKAPQDFESDKPFPLQISYIQDQDRTLPDRFCRLIHQESQIDLPGQFTYGEAKEILETTRYWDFSLDRDKIPKCAERLRSLLENICFRSDIGGNGNA